MKKNFATPLLFIFLLVQCNHNKSEQIEGTWQLQTLEINGTVLKGNSLGDWQWKFATKENYTSVIAGKTEEGLYTLKEGKLTLKSTTYKERPEQILSIIHLDSIQMDLISADDKNKSTLHFLKLKD